jgi:hypothetical protein
MKILPALICLLLLVGIGSATTDTFYATTTNADGRISNFTNQSYYITRVGDGDSITTAPAGVISITGLAFVNPALNVDSLIRFFWSRDTSSLPDDAVISAASYCVRAESGSTNAAGSLSAGITGFTPANPLALAAGDYDTVGSTLYSDTYISYASWTAGYQCFPLNAAGIAAISKTGNTSIVLRIKDDILNTTAEFTDTTAATSVLKGYDTSQGTTYRPYLSVTYTSASGVPSVSFTSNKSGIIAPRRNIVFADTSTISSPTGYAWAYKDFSTLPMVPTGGRIWNTFSTSQNPTYAWGAGNWSIRLTVTNASGSYITTDYYHWINVSAGRSDNYTMSPGNYRFYPLDTVWYQNVTELPVNTSSATWIAGLTAEAGGLGNHLHYTTGSSTTNGGQFQQFIVNDTITKQYTTNYPGSSYNGYHYVDWAAYPIPDDIVPMTGSSDLIVHLIDINNKTVYELYQVVKNANGTIESSASIWNYSTYNYRFSKYANGTDNGVTWLGNAYQEQNSPGVYTSRDELIPTFWTSMSGAPIFPSLIRREELATGVINHSLYVVVPVANGTATWPAMASGHWGETGASGWVNHAPPCGAVMRLKSTYDINTNISGTKARIVAQALKTYGAWIGENGASYSAHIMTYNNTATPWTSAENADLSTLNVLHIDDFEFVDMDSVMIGRYSMRVTSDTDMSSWSAFTKTASVIKRGKEITFTASSSEPSYYTWNFGDNTMGYTNVVTHTYTNPGRKAVTLTTEGGTVTAYVTVIGSGPEQQFTPFKSLMVNLDDGTYTTSRNLTDAEIEKVIENMYK